MVVLYILAGIFGVIFADIVFLAILALFAGRERYGKYNKFYAAVYKFHCRIAIFFSNVKITVKGREKLDGINGKFLLVGNHRSNYDPFVTFLALKKDIAFISKPENFKVPIFGRIVRRCCYLSIDRTNPKNAVKTLNYAAELISGGAASVGVYPEGTRSKGKEMLAFHDGVFKIAQKAACPIAVAAVSGTERIHKRAPFLRTKVTVEIADVIYPENFAGLSSHDISAVVKDTIKAATEKNDAAK